MCLALVLIGAGEGGGVAVGLGTGVGVAVGDGVGDGVAVGAGLGVAVGAGVGIAVLPLNEIFAGAANMFPGTATNPKLTVPPGGIDWFQETGTALYVIPAKGATDASQNEDTRWTISNCSAQLLIVAEPLLVIVKSP